MADSIKQRIEALCKHVDELSVRYYETMGYTFGQPPVHRAEYISPKWCRIVTVERGKDGSEHTKSVYCFVALKDNQTKSLGRVTTGDIHKAATFKSAARHARGSVFADDFGGSLSHYGPAYLR